MKTFLINHTLPVWYKTLYVSLTNGQLRWLAELCLKKWTTGPEDISIFYLNKGSLLKKLDNWTNEDFLSSHAQPVWYKTLNVSLTKSQSRYLAEVYLKKWTIGPEDISIFYLNKGSLFKNLDNWTNEDFFCQAMPNLFDTRNSMCHWLRASQGV